MSIAHGAQHASPTIPLLLAGATPGAESEPFEPIGEGFEYIGERLAVLAVAARIMARRYPGDVYARSIARETLRLAGAMREALHTEDATRNTRNTRNTAPASYVIDTTLATPATPASPSSPSSPSSASSTPPDATPATRHRGSARTSSRASSSSKRKGGAA